VNGIDPDRCSGWQLMLHGFVDGELDAAHSLEFEQHLATCPDCAGQLERFQTLKQVVSQKGVRWRTPDHVRARVLAAIAQEAAKQQPRPAASRSDRLFGLVRQWLFVPSLAALAASLFLVLGPMQNRSSIQDEVVAGHVRSTLANHLTDVATSDQHTVKPWFNGKIDFSPPVVDLAKQGFPLVGGRVDYIGGRVVAALVYRRRGHLINVFVWPASSAAITETTRDGYNIENWSKDGLTFWAVSDAAPDEVSGFREAFLEQTGK
jgi:anti-sigma factor RsiW